MERLAELSFMASQLREDQESAGIEDGKDDEAFQSVANQLVLRWIDAISLIESEPISTSLAAQPEPQPIHFVEPRTSQDQQVLNRAHPTRAGP